MTEIALILHQPGDRPVARLGKALGGASPTGRTRAVLATA